MESVLEYEIILTTQARKLFAQIKDRREQQLLLTRIDKLKQDPDKQGKALSDSPKNWGNLNSKSPRIGGFRGHSTIYARGLLASAITYGSAKSDRI